VAIDTTPAAAGQDQEATQPPTETRVTTRRVLKRRRRIRALGSYLVVIGILTIGFVAYEYFGTSYLTTRAQASLRAHAQTHGFIQYGGVPDDRNPVTAAPPKIFRGDALGEIRIPRMSLDMIFVQGADRESLKKGPGHYVETPLPGQGGNVGIAGHRTTYLHPFWSLNEMRKGDLITLITSKGTFVYRVVWLRIVEPGNKTVLAWTPKPSLTLTACHPRFYATQRIIVRAEQVSGPGMNAAFGDNNS
jgi:sortase A